MPQTHLHCDKCGTWSIIKRIEGVLQTRPMDLPPYIVITILCPKCGEVELTKQPHEMQSISDTSH